MRTFVALNLPAAERLRTHRAAAALREVGLPVRWVEPEKLHLTLKFLGEVGPEGLARVRDVMERVASATRPITLSLGGFGAFPTLRRPRVLWVGIDATPELRCLKQDLDWGLCAEGFEPESRDFHPHLTLGRADPRRGAGAFRELELLARGLDFATAFSVATLDLMGSQLSGDGARYSLLHRAGFGGT